MAKNKPKERRQRERETRRLAKQTENLASVSTRLRSDDLGGMMARAPALTKDLPIDLAPRDIESIARRVNANPIILAPHAPEPTAKQRECFLNAIRKSERDGGFAVWGWTFHAALTRIGPYAWITHHGMWMPGDRVGELVDVTPFPDTSKDRPTLVDGLVAFLPEPKASPWIAPGLLGTLPQRKFALSVTPPPLVAWLEEANEREEGRLAAEIAAALARDAEGRGKE